MLAPTDRALAQWVADQQERAPCCACGCGRRIRVRPEHRKHGLPRFIHGHHNRVSARDKSSELTAWIAQERGKHFCLCGCGKVIEIRRHHRKAGIPRYCHRHGLKGSQNPRYLGVDAWVAANQGRHACACGCGGTITVLPRHHWTGRIPRFIKGHHKRLKGARCSKYLPDRAKVKSGRNGQYFYASLRESILDRDGRRCVKCGSDEHLNVDHVVPISRGGTAVIANGQTMCRACHVIKTRAERRWLLLKRQRERVELEACRLLLCVRVLVKRLEECRGCHRKSALVRETVQIRGGDRRCGTLGVPEMF